MGCFQSSTATTGAANNRRAGGASQGAALASASVLTEVPAHSVLTEVPAHERAVAQLRSTFEGVSANEDGHASKRELTAALEKDQPLAQLLKEAEMNEMWHILNVLLNHDSEYISLEVFQDFAKKAITHEVKECERQVAAELSAQEKVLHHIQEVFANLAADEDGAVSKQELSEMLAKEEAAIRKLVVNAVLDPCWNTIAPLDTNKDGHITWEELKAHISSAVKEAEKDIEDRVDEIAHGLPGKGWFGCC